MNASYTTGLSHFYLTIIPWPSRFLSSRPIFLVLAFILIVFQVHAQSTTGLDAAEMPDLPSLPTQMFRPTLPGWAPVSIELGTIKSTEFEISGNQEELVLGPVIIGYQRLVPELEDPNEFWARQAWYWTGDGGLAFAFRITSPGAQALRLGVHVFNIPDTAIMKIHGPDRKQAQEVTGAKIKASLQRNQDAGEAGEDAETYWSSVIGGEAAIIEIELPASANPDELKLALPRISHLFQSPLGARELNENEAVPCHLDVMCYPAWDAQSKSTARMVFTKEGSTYICTGTLLNDSDPSTFIPYFYTANHCISTQTVASSLETYWFWRASACNSGKVGNFQSRSGGADLLYASANTDTSFLRLSAAPPNGAIFAGWATSLPTNQATLTGIHHPGGDLQKISFGSQDAYWYCWDGGDGFYYCQSSTANSANFFSVSWQGGITEPGSSGSGIFFSDTLQFAGSLQGGSSSCANPSGPDYYGRFDIAYQAEIHKWLNSPFIDVPPNSWATKYINAIFKAGITSGCGNSNYCPGGLVTREEMAAFLVRALDAEPPVNYCGGVPPFNDVSPGAWSCGYIKRLDELKITGGCGNASYCPTGLVTREQMAAFIVRALKKEPGLNYCAGVAPFNDIAPGAWSCGYIKRLAELKITGGCGNGNYCPAGLVTREQMAAFLARAFLSME
jgi:hypothetical protein